MRRSARLWAAMVLAFSTVGLGGCGDDETPAPGTGTGTGAGGGGGADIAIEGLGSPVEVVYDQHGIVHLTCQSDDDCFAAMGYVHAANRFFTMHFVRLAIRGKLASAVDGGDTVLESDVYYRHFFSTRDGEPLEDAIMAEASSEVVNALERYAAGVNAWIEDAEAERNGASYTDEFFLLSPDIRPWEPEDSLAMAFYLMEDLGSSVGDELRYGEMVAALSPELAADLLMVRPPFDDFTIPAAGGTYGTSLLEPRALPPGARAIADRLDPARPLLARARQRLERLWSRHGADRTSSKGSNNWVVGPGSTTAGHALLANDPHLSMSNPAIFLPMEIDSKSAGAGTLHVAGGTIPALPAVLSGHNEDLAWGVTTVVYDLNEIYVEQLDDQGTQVMYEGDWVPITAREVSFETVDGSTVTRTLEWVPHHGPIIDKDLASHQALSVRWVLHDGMSDIEGFLALNRASSVAEVPAALASLTATDQNFVAIDREGNIGWYPMGQVPNRPWASLAMPAWAPVPGDGSAEWSGFVDQADLPQLYNPPNELIATANQDITGATADGDPCDDGHPVLQGWDSAYGARLHRIVAMLENRAGEHSVQSMLGIQANTRSAIGTVVLPPLLAELESASLGGEAERVRSALESWQYTCPSGLDGVEPDAAKDDDPVRARESIGCTAFHTLLYLIFDGMLADEEAAAEVDFFFRSKVNLLITDLTEPGALVTGGSYWDDVSTAAVETRLDVLTAAAEQAGALLGELSSDPDDWRWGRVHTVTFTSILGGFGILTFNEGPYVNDGGLSTVDVAAPQSAEDLTQNHGATIRTVIEAAPDGMRMKFQTAGGTSNDPESPFYQQLVERYLRNQPIDFPFGPGAVTSPQLEQQLVPAP